jgi:hypothetical protein
MTHPIINKLEEALEIAGGTHHWREHVVPLLFSGRAQYWHRPGGAIVTEIIETPLRRAVNYWLVGGEMQDCLALQPEIDAWARQQGATHATAVGRLGWARVLPPYGWRMHGVAMVKEL